MRKLETPELQLPTADQGTAEAAAQPHDLRLSTPRLDLVAATIEHVEAELRSPEHLARLLAADVDAGWPPGEYDRSAQEFFRDCLTEGGPKVVGWYGWYAIRRGDAERPAVVVGAGGYLGPPSEDGEVEIGFSVVPAWRGHGYASELAAALVANALADPRVMRVVAHTSEENHASRRVLAHAGLRCVGGGREPGELRFERRR